MPADIVVVGSLNMDFAVFVPQIPTVGETVLGQQVTINPGGKGANQAFAAAKLGGRTAMVGKVGQDFLGGQLREHLSRMGVDVSCVYIDESDTATGMAVICIDPSGRNAIAVAPGANRSLSVSDVERADSLFAKGRLLLIQLEIPMETVLYGLRRAKFHGMTTMLDPAPAVPMPNEVLQLVDVLTPNETEARILLNEAPGAMSIHEAEHAAVALRSRGANTVIVKLGDKGAWLQAFEGIAQHYPAYEVCAVDSTAAGDVFNGALAVALSEGKPLGDATRFANAAAALSTTRRGAQASTPDRSEVEEFIVRGAPITTVRPV
jgi:ribokinase